MSRYDRERPLQSHEHDRFCSPDIRRQWSAETEERERLGYLETTDNWKMLRQNSDENKFQPEPGHSNGKPYHEEEMDRVKNQQRLLDDSLRKIIELERENGHLRAENQFLEKIVSSRDTTSPRFFGLFSRKSKAEEALERKVAELERDIESLKRKEDHTKQENTRLKKDIREKNEEFVHLKIKFENETSNLQRQASGLERDKAHLQKELEQQKQEHERKLADMRKKKDAEMESLQREREEEVKKMERRHEEDIQSMVENEERIQKKYREETILMKKEMDKEEKKQTEGEVQIHNLQRLQEDAYRKLREGSQKITELEHKIDKLQEENDGLNREIANGKSIGQVSIEEKQKVEKQLTEKEGELQELRYKMETLQTEYKWKIRQAEEAARRDCNSTWETRKREQAKKMEDSMKALERHHDEEIEALRQLMQKQEQLMQGKHKSEIQVLMQDINKTHKHYKGQMDFMRQDMLEQMQRMERRQESVLRTGERMLDEREQQVDELLDAQQRARQFLLENEFRPRGQP